MTAKHTHIETFVLIEGVTRRVSLEINDDLLARILGRKALASKGKMATAQFKAIVARLES